MKGQSQSINVLRGLIIPQLLSSSAASARACAHWYSPHPAQISTDILIMADTHPTKTIGRVWQSAHDITPSRSARCCRCHRYRAGSQLPTRGHDCSLSKGMLLPRSNSADSVVRKRIQCQDHILGRDGAAGHCRTPQAGREDTRQRRQSFLRPQLGRHLRLSFQTARRLPQGAR